MGAAASQLAQIHNIINNRNNYNYKNIDCDNRTVRERFNAEFGVRKPSQRKNYNILGDDDTAVAGRDDTTRDKRVQINRQVFRAKSLFMRPVLSKRGDDTSGIIKRQDQSQILRELFRRMDPTSSSMTSSRRDVSGEVELMTVFKRDENLLLVNVERARGLVRTSDYSRPPNPFVVVDMFSVTNPDELETQKSAVVRTASCPEFRENFLFRLSGDDMSRMRIRITLVDKIQTWQEEFLGEIQLAVSKPDVSETSNVQEKSEEGTPETSDQYSAIVTGNENNSESEVSTWHRLAPKTDISYSGTLQLNIFFTLPSSLRVTLKQANNVKPCNDDDLTSNPYAKIYVTTCPTTFQTGVVYRTTSPTWMESFDFDVEIPDIQRAFIVVNVLNKNNRGPIDQHIGDVHVPLAKLELTRGSVNKEYLLKDLRNTSWSRSGRTDQDLSKEFREAMRAHVRYGLPRCVFTKYDIGRTVVLSCKSRKAHKSAQIVVRNGTVVA